MSTHPPRTLSWPHAGKLQPPEQRIRQVRRESLLPRLQAGLEQPLSLLVAPPGFGKTTVLSQCWETLRQRDDSVAAWLSIDEDDARAERLMASLLLALAEAGLDIDADIRDAAATRELPPERGLPALIGAAGASAVRVVLIIDDYHRAAGPAPDALIQRLLHSRVPALRVIIGTRDLPHIHLSELRARGLVTLLHGGELAFTEAESAQLFDGVASAAAHLKLYRRTEGWPVASQLARLWLQDGGAARRTEAGLLSHDGHIAAYLSDCVLNDLPEAARELLTDVSIFEHFSAALADAVRGRSDSRQLLGELGRLDALLIPLDGERRTLRLHPLLRDFLYGRLTARTADAATVLHQRAADWLQAHGDLLESVRHRLAIGDVERSVAQVMQAGGWKLPLTHGIGFCASLLDCFTPEQIDAQLSLGVVRAYLDIKLGEWNAAQQRMESLRLQSGSMDALQQRHFRVVNRLWDGYGDSEEAAPGYLAALRADVDAPSPDPLDEATLHAVFAKSAISLGEFGIAESAGHEAVRRMQAANSAVGAGYVLLHMGHGYYLQGRWDEAESTLHAALAIAEEHSAKDSMVKAGAESVLARLQLQRNRLDLAAQRALPALARIEEQDGWFDLLASAYEAAIGVTAALSGVAAVEPLLRRAERCAMTRRLPRLARCVNAWRRERGLGGGEDPIDNAPAHWRAHYVATRAALREGLRQNRLAAVLKLADTTAQRCRDGARRADAAECDLYAALALKARGDKAASLMRLDEALAFAADQGAVRCFLDAGAGVESLLLAWLRSGAAAGARTRMFVNTVLMQMRCAATPQLSAREIDVLRALCVGDSNKAIGRLLDLSENTVKFHIKNIFRKLEVDCRTAALAAAHRLGLLPPAPAPRTPPDHTPPTHPTG